MKNIKQAIRSIEKLTNQMSEGIYMDNLMDGSGECGGMIVNGWSNWFTSRVDNILSEHQLTIEDVKRTCDEWARLELDKGPKQQYIYMYSKKDGMWIDKDYLDTRYGQVIFTLMNV